MVYADVDTRPAKLSTTRHSPKHFKKRNTNFTTLMVFAGVEFILVEIVVLTPGMIVEGACGCCPAHHKRKGALQCVPHTLISLRSVVGDGMVQENLRTPLGSALHRIFSFRHFVKSFAVASNTKKNLIKVQ